MKGLPLPGPGIPPEEARLDDWRDRARRAGAYLLQLENEAQRLRESVAELRGRWARRHERQEARSLSWEARYQRLHGRHERLKAEAKLLRAQVKGLRAQVRHFEKQDNREKVTARESPLGGP